MQQAATRKIKTGTMNGKNKEDMTHEQLRNLLLMKREMSGINFEDAFKWYMLVD